MTKIRRFKAADVMQMQLRETDKRNLEGVDLEKHGRELELTPEAVTILTDEGEIIASVGGFVWGKTCLVFLLTGVLVEHFPLVVLKVVKKFIERGVVHGVVRFETLVSCDDARAVRFIEHLGFEREGLCRATGDNLQDRYMYALIRMPSVVAEVK